MLTLQAEEMAARAEIIRRFQGPALMTSLIQKAVRDAVLEHKRNRNPVAGSVNGQVVIFQPEDIEVSDDESDQGEGETQGNKSSMPLALLRIC